MVEQLVDHSPLYRTIVAPQGDLDLIINSSRVIQVDSAVLIRASPVIRAMIGPHFAEGQQQPGRQKVVSFRDEHISTMILLCQLLHAHTVAKTMFDGLSIEDIIRFARTVDKYDCSEAMALAIDGLFARHQRSQHLKSPKHSMSLAGAAFLLSQGYWFESFTRRMILECSFPYKDVESILPTIVLHTMSERRAKCQRAILLAVKDRNDLVAALSSRLFELHAAPEPVMRVLALLDNPSVVDFDDANTGLCLACIKSPNHDCGKHKQKRRPRVNQSAPQTVTATTTSGSG